MITRTKGLSDRAADDLPRALIVGKHSNLAMIGTHESLDFVID
jgi:hypothetical protein